MQILPLGNRVVVTLLEEAKTSSSGIILTTNPKEQKSRGTVVSIGNGAGTDENVTDLGLSVGDIILFSSYGGEEIKDDSTNTTYKILNSTDILAIIK